MVKQTSAAATKSSSSNKASKTSKLVTKANKNKRKNGKTIHSGSISLTKHVYKRLARRAGATRLHKDLRPLMTKDVESHIKLLNAHAQDFAAAAGVKTITREHMKSALNVSGSTLLA